MPTILDLTDATADTEISKPGRILVVFFYATWDAASRTMGPTIEALASEYPSITFARLDAGANTTAAANYGVKAVPTLFAFKNGQRVGQILGARPKADIAKALDGL